MRFLELVQAQWYHEVHRPEYYLKYINDRPIPRNCSTHPNMCGGCIDFDDEVTKPHTPVEFAEAVPPVLGKQSRKISSHDCAENNGKDCDPLFDMTKEYWHTKMHGREVNRRYSTIGAVLIGKRR